MTTLSTPAQGSAAPGDRAPPVLLPLVQQHAEEAAFLRHSRGTLVRAPHVGLLMLGRHDERIEAHLDGLLVAGDAGVQLARQFAQEDGSTEACFVAAVLALRRRDEAWLDALLAAASDAADAADPGDAAASRPPAWRGLASALGWVAADTLQGVARRLLAASHPMHRALGLEACRMHRVDPGALLVPALADRSAPLRACALRAAGDLGRTDLLGPVRAAMGDGEPEVVLQAAHAACRLGERQAALQVLTAAAQQPDRAGQRHAVPALALLMAAHTTDAAQEVARHLSAVAQSLPTPASQRRLMQALALLGDTRHVPWLLQRMHHPAWARLAGEAFTWITGVDLVAQQLESLEPPAGAEDAGPTEDPADDGLALDDDANLPWPDADRVQAWWQRRPQPGQRLFMGRPQGDTAALSHTLLQGNQRQRRHAALLLGLAQPQAPLLPVAAPAWRQRRWLQAAGA